MDIVHRILREPARIVGVVTVTLATFSVFNVIQLTPEQSDALLAAVGVWLVFLGFIVTPTNDPVLPENQSVRLKDGSTGTVVKD
jgi:hypothetical protein